jgi:hypothetical protein
VWANAVSGTPILGVDHARSVVVKRSMGPGSAGIANDLFFAPKAGMRLVDIVLAVEAGRRGLNHSHRTSRREKPTIKGQRHDHVRRARPQGRPQ